MNEEKTREGEREKKKEREEESHFFLLRIRGNRKSTATVGRAGFRAFWRSYSAGLFVAFSLSFFLFSPILRVSV